MVSVVDGGVEDRIAGLRPQLTGLIERPQHRHTVEGEADVGGDPRQREGDEEDPRGDAQQVAGQTARARGGRAPADSERQQEREATPTAATAFTGRASRSDCLTTPGQKTAAQSAIAKSPVTSSVRDSSPSTSTSRTATAAIAVEKFKKTRARPAPAAKPLPVT